MHRLRFPRPQLSGNGGSCPPLFGKDDRPLHLRVLAARVTKPNLSDGSQLGYLLRGLDGEGKRLLGDSAYDWRRDIELAPKRGFKPLFKPRDIEHHGLFRKMVLRDFRRNRKLYRRRSIGEAIFAGIEDRYGAHTKCRRIRTKVLNMLLMLMAHHLRAYMRVRAVEKMGFIFAFWIFFDTYADSVLAHLLFSSSGELIRGEERGHLSAV